MKKSKKILKNKEIEYGSTKKKYIDKTLEETLRRSGFQRKFRSNEPKLPKEIKVSKKIDPDLVKLKLPRNIDSEIIIKPEKKWKKIEIKQEKVLIDLPSHLEFEAPETIQVKTGIKRIVEDTEGAEYGDLPEEIDIVHEETKEEKKKKEKSFFSTLKQTFGFSDNEKEEEEDLEIKKEELRKSIENKEGKEIDEPVRKNPENIILNEREEVKPQETKEEINDINQEFQEQSDNKLVERENKQEEEKREEERTRPLIKKIKEFKDKIKKDLEDEKEKNEEDKKSKGNKEELISDIDENGLEPIKFTDKKVPEERKYQGYNKDSAPEVLENEDDEDSSMDIMYSKPKKKLN